MDEKVLIAMSGGVDSSVAAYLLKKQGYGCTGVTMRLLACCGEDSFSGKSAQDAEDAHGVCDALGISHHVVDLSKDFSKLVIDRFIASYISGATPNPCVFCNRDIKFGVLLRMAKELGAKYLATGHYARCSYDEESGRYLLKKALDNSKDQSYFLYTLSQDQLSGVLFPLGNLTKVEVRKIAAEQGFVSAHKEDSQDICFVRSGDYTEFIEHYAGSGSCAGFMPGNFIDLSGNVLGQHRGLIRYTVGQRKGLGLALPAPMYVHSKDAENNTVTLCSDSDLFTRVLEASDFNRIAFDSPSSCIRADVKIRYSQSASPATAEQVSPDVVRITFDDPQRAVTRGQAVVLYDGDTVLGGGTIC